MTFCLMIFGTSIFDGWCWTPWPMTPSCSTWPTFDSTDLSPYQPSPRDFLHYDHNYTIIFDLTDLRLLNPSFLTCEFRAMFIILDRSMLLHHWDFTFDFLAFDFYFLTCDQMSFCLMTFGTSIFDQWCYTPWPMTPRSFTWPTFDSTDLSPYRPSNRDLWHYDHNYTIIFDLTDLRLFNLSFLICEFRAMFIILDRSTPLHHWYFSFDFVAFDFQVVTCDPMIFLPDDLWHQHPCLMMLNTMTFETKIFLLTDLRLYWPFTLPTFDSWPLRLRP